MMNNPQSLLGKYQSRVKIDPSNIYPAGHGLNMNTKAASSTFDNTDPRDNFELSLNVKEGLIQKDKVLSIDIDNYFSSIFDLKSEKYRNYDRMVSQFKKKLYERNLERMLPFEKAKMLQNAQRSRRESAKNSPDSRH